MDKIIRKHMLPNHTVKYFHSTNCSKLYKVEDADDKISVIKVFNKEESPYGGEPYLLAKLNHPNIISPMKCWKFGIHYYLHLPCASSDLEKFLEKQQNPLTEQHSRSIFGQVVAGVAHAHKNNICHRDIKTNNILVFDDGQRFVLCDFGLAREFSAGKLIQECAGSSYYLPPEILNDEDYVGPEVDMWALGILLCRLLTKKYPFENPLICEKFNHAVTNAIYDMPKNISPELQDIICGLLCPDRTKRLTITDVQEHSWLKNKRRKLNDE